MDTLIGQLGQFFALNEDGGTLHFSIGTKNVLKVVVYFFSSFVKAIGLPLIKVFKPANQFCPALDNVKILMIMFSTCKVILFISLQVLLFQ